mmetsp:Transcript_29552/g.77511  ORF Transcript_29552/g.77511 Transcript_29552/m.77511 type:complete len:209 (+) Transcript_29552:1430-2056(+)
MLSTAWASASIWVQRVLRPSQVVAVAVVLRRCMTRVVDAVAGRHMAAAAAAAAVIHPLLASVEVAVHGTVAAPVVAASSALLQWVQAYATAPTGLSRLADVPPGSQALTKTATNIASLKPCPPGKQYLMMMALMMMTLTVRQFSSHVHNVTKTVKVQQLSTNAVPRRQTSLCGSLLPGLRGRRQAESRRLPPLCGLRIRRALEQVLLI